LIARRGGPAAPVSRPAPGAGRRSGRGERRGFGRPSDPSGNLCLGFGGGWPHGRARTLHVPPRPSSPERRPSRAIVPRLGAMLHARRFQSVSFGWGPSEVKRRGPVRTLARARAHLLRGTGRGAEDGGEQGRREYERGAGARHGDGCRGSCHFWCRWEGRPRRLRVAWTCECERRSV